jgi:hypothetical protein
VSDKVQLLERYEELSRNPDLYHKATVAASLDRLVTVTREQGERITELEEDAEACAEYEADALRRIGEEVIAGRQHEARGELPYWISQVHEHYRKKLAEQDKRARYAEQERDAFDKRIAELEAELAIARRVEDLTSHETRKRIAELSQGPNVIALEALRGVRGYVEHEAECDDRIAVKELLEVIDSSIANLA